MTDGLGVSYGCRSGGGGIFCVFFLAVAVGVGGIVLSKKLEVLPVNGGVVVREV